MTGRLVTLTTYYSLIEARVCVSMLQAYGIYALAPMEFATVSSNYVTAIGGIPVHVTERDLDAARALIGQVREENPSGPRPVRPFWRVALEMASGLLVLLVFAVPPAPRPAFPERRLRYAIGLLFVSACLSLWAIGWEFGFIPALLYLLVFNLPQDL